MINKIKELISGVTRNEQDVIIQGLQSQISRANRIVASVEAGYYDVANRLDHSEKENKRLRGLNDRMIKRWEEQRARLNEIASLETPSANGTSKKMAKIARGDV